MLNKTLFPTCLAALFLLVGMAAVAQEPVKADLATLKQLPAEAMAGTPRDLKVELIGPGASTAWLAYYAPFLEYGIYQNPENGHWMQVMAFKKNGKDERVTHFALIDIEEKTVTELGNVPGWHEYVCLWLDGKFYMGMNNVVLPGRLAVFDPRTKKLTDLGSPFKHNGLIRGMAVSPDGKLALGGDPPEVAIYDPETGEYDYYGATGSPKSTKVYYVSMDDDYIYASVRGTDPWHLVAINRKTREQKELMQVPVQGILALGRQGTIWVEDDLNDKDAVKKEYYVKDGAVHESASRDESKKQLADVISRIGAHTKFVRKEAPPTCAVDYSPTYQGKPEIRFIYAKPDAPDDVWREVTFPLPLANHRINRIAEFADGRLAYSGEKYAPLAVWDPDPDITRQMPNRTKAYHNSVYSLVVVGNTVFEGGYASAIVLAFKPDEPVTQVVNMPGRKAVPFKSPDANPRLVEYFSNLADGAHMAVAMEVGADNRVYVCARRHRYFYGFDICWFAPEDFSKRGVLEHNKALDHYQISWMDITPDGKTLLVSSYVQGNPQINSPKPTEAKLFLFDVEKKVLARSIVPLPGATSLSGIAPVDDKTLVGAAYLEDEDTTVLYRLDLATDKVTAVRKYSGKIHGKPGTTDLPTKGYDFVTGPDGGVWTLGRLNGDGPQCLMRIDPADLSIAPVCVLGGSNIRLVFRGRDIIATGEERLQRIVNVLDEPKP